MNDIISNPQVMGALPAFLGVAIAGIFSVLKLIIEEVERSQSTEIFREPRSNGILQKIKKLPDEELGCF